MKQENKDLLLADLCSRLPYGVKVAIEYTEGKYTRIYDLREIDNDVTSELRQRVTVWNYGFYSSVISYPLIDCRPYLRPMSSMTEEEWEELNSIGYIVPLYDGCFGVDMRAYCKNNQPHYRRFSDFSTIEDWLNAHHFDYRGLIEKGLALEAPDGMYNIKEYNKI
jgi:hypothetical protein